jgi:hypothetical protein
MHALLPIILTASHVLLAAARAVAALCKSGADRERELGRLDADVEHINGVIAVGCL